MRTSIFMACVVYLCHCSGSTLLGGDAQDSQVDVPIDMTSDEIQVHPEIPECPAGCDDHNPCTSDECVDDVCVHVPLPDGTPCILNERCPADSSCNSGMCTSPLRPDEGSILWSKSLEPPDHGTAILHEPGGDLVVLSASRVERLTQDGEVVWSVPAYLDGNLGQLESMIAGDVVVTAQYDQLIGLDLDSGEKIWSADTGGYIDSTALGTDDLVIVASLNLSSGPPMLAAFAADSGELAWSRVYDVRIGELAVDADGLTYASNGGQESSPGYILGLEPGGAERFRIEVFNWGRPWLSVDSFGAGVSTYPFSRVGPGGELLYAGTFGSFQEAVIAPDQSIVLVGDNMDAVVRWLGPAGEVLREQPIGDNTLNHPLVDACGIVYLVTYHGTIIAFDPGGKERWSNSVGSPEIVESVPDLSDAGVLYVATYDTIYAVQAAGAPLADTSWPGFRADSQGTARARR